MFPNCIDRLGRQKRETKQTKPIWCFLQMCHQDGLTPKFLNFKLANSSLKHSKTYKQCQSMLFKEEIKTKRSIISKQKKALETVRNSIKKTVSLFDFAHLSCLFLIGNDNKLVKIKQIHYKKLHALGKDSSIGTHDPDKVIFNTHLVSCLMLKRMY